MTTQKADGEHTKKDNAFSDGQPASNKKYTFRYSKEKIYICFGNDCQAAIHVGPERRHS